MPFACTESACPRSIASSSSSRVITIVLGTPRLRASAKSSARGICSSALRGTAVSRFGSSWSFAEVPIRRLAPNPTAAGLGVREFRRAAAKLSLSVT